MDQEEKEQEMSDETVRAVEEFHHAFGLRAPSRVELHEGNDIGLQGCAAILRQLSTNAGRLAEGEDQGSMMRIHLLTEELAELVEGLAARDAVAVLDALTDLQYVLDGTYVTLGMSDLKMKAFREVHRSNMNKLVDGEPLLSAGGRVLKPTGWEAPDLLSIIRGSKVACPNCGKEGRHGWWLDDLDGLGITTEGGETLCMGCRGREFCPHCGLPKTPVLDPGDLGDMERATYIWTDGEGHRSCGDCRDLCEEGAALSSAGAKP